MTVQFAKNSEFLEAVALLVDLQFAICEKDEDRADTLRDALDVPLSRLSWEANEWLRGLSGDLDMLCNQEVFEPSELSTIDYQRGLLTAWRNMENDPETVLALLRKEQNVLPPDAVAYFRGRAYSLLDLHHVGILFLRRAVELNPERTRYKVILLSGYWSVGGLDQAKPLAEIIFNNAGSDRESILLTAGIMLQLIKNAPPIDRQALGELKRHVEQVIRSIPQLELMKDLASFGFILLGMISEALSRTAQARENYSKACQLTTGSETPFLFRGRLLFRLGDEKAILDFRHAANIGSTDPLPYLVLARESLKLGHYAECQTMCLSAIRVGGPMVQGQAYELMAIAEAQANGETDLAQHYFDEALRLFPSNSNIQRNQAMFEQARRELLEQDSYAPENVAEYQFDLQEENKAVQNDPFDLMLKAKSSQLWSGSNPLNTPLGMAA